MSGVLIILFHPICIDLMLCHLIVLQTEKKKQVLKLLFSHVFSHPFPDISGETQPWVRMSNSLILGIIRDKFKKIIATEARLIAPLKVSKGT